MMRIVLLMLVASLGACSANDDAQQRTDAGQRFDEAMTAIDNANAGYVVDLSADIMDLDGYRRAELAKAVGILQDLTSTGTANQRLAASLALADAHAQLGRMSALDGYNAWTQHAKNANNALILAAAAQHAQQVAQAHQALDRSGVVGATRQRAASLKQNRNAQQLKVDQLAGRIDTLEKTKQQTQQRRDGMVEQSRQFSERKLEADSPDKRYQMQLKVEQFTRQADAADAEIDRLDNQLIGLRAAYEVASAELSYIQQLTRAAESSLADHEKRYVGHDQGVIADSQNRATDAGTKMMAELKETDEYYTANVTAPYTKAIGHFGTAIATLNQARTTAPSDQQKRVKLELATKVSEAASVQRQLAVMDAAYVDFLGVIAAQAARGFPAGPANAVAKQVTARTEAAAASREQTVEALNAAIEPITQANAVAGDGPMLVATLEQLADVYDALAEITGELDMRSKAQQQRQLIEAARIGG